MIGAQAAGRPRPKLGAFCQRRRAAPVSPICVLLLIVFSQVFQCTGQASRLRDRSRGLLIRNKTDDEARAPIKPPTRPLPPETIVLEGGATTFTSSLDDFLAASKRPDELEHEDDVDTSSLQIVNRLETTTGANFPAVAKLNRSSKLAILFTASPTADEKPLTSRPPEVHTSLAAGSSEAHQHQEHRHGPEGAGKHEKGGTAAAAASGPKPIPQHWQVKSLLNVTHDYPLAYSQIICGYVWPLMAAITLFTNLMIVFVLTQRDMRTPTNVVLTAIAIADIIPIVVPVPWFVYLFAMGNEKQVLYPPMACYFYQHSTRSVSEIFYFLSTWLNVLLAIQDYLAACQPKLAQKYCQIKVVVLEIILLTLAAFLLNLPQALKLVFKPVKFYYNGQLTWGCKALQAKWFKDLVGEYVALYDDIFTAIIVLFVDGGPAVVLITLTALLIRQLKRQRVKGLQLMEQARTASKRRRERHRQQEYESSARVMIFVLLAFLAVKIPFATTYTLMIIQSRFEIHFVENLVDFQKAITITDLVFVLSYPINFTIFCCCSKKFRHKCAQLLGECNEGPLRDSSLASHSTRLMSNASGVSNPVEMVGDQWLSGAVANSHGASSPFELRQEEGAGRKQFSLAEFANNAKIPPFNRRPGQEQADQGEAAGHSSDSASPTSASAEPASSGQQQLLGPADERLRRVLAEGSLCLECIVCYERMRSESSLLQLSEGRRTSCAHGSGLVEPEVMGRQQRRASGQSSGGSSQISWPAGPQLRSLFGLRERQQQLARGQLPEIVTTACESIREQTSADEERGQLELEVCSSDGEEFTSEAVTAERSAEMDWREVNFGELGQARELDGERGGSQELDRKPGGSLRHRPDNSAGYCEPRARSSLPSSRPTGLLTATGSSQSSSGTSGGATGRVYRSSSRDTNEYEAQTARHQQQAVGARGRALGLISTLMMTRASSSEPSELSESPARPPEAAGDSEAERPSAAESQRPEGPVGRSHRSASGAGAGSPRQAVDEHDDEEDVSGRQASAASDGRLGEARSRLGSRQRSLSLSNSNLTTLPNATGMLADVLVSALFGAGVGTGTSEGSARSLGRARRRGKKDKRRS